MRDKEYITRLIVQHESALKSVKVEVPSNRDALAEIERLTRERDEARAEVADLARARHYLKEALRGSHSIESCKDPECPICGIILCPFDADEHLWKDGCPACYCTPVDPEREH